MYLSRLKVKSRKRLNSLLTLAHKRRKRSQSQPKRIQKLSLKKSDIRQESLRLRLNWHQRG